MRFAKFIILAVTFVGLFFVRYWVLCGMLLSGYCSRFYWVVRPGSWSPLPVLSFPYPNFYTPPRCGPVLYCVPAQWSFLVLIVDLILWALVNLILFLIINKVSGKIKPKYINQKGFSSIVLLVIIVIILAGIGGYYVLKKPAPVPTVSSTPINTATPSGDKNKVINGQFCGGIAGIMCSSGYYCKLDGSYPDAGGVCVKTQGGGRGGFCIQMAVRAKNPVTGEISGFPTPCDVPEGWAILY